MSENTFLKTLDNLLNEKKISPKYFKILSDFYNCYKKEVENHIPKEELDLLFNTLLKLILDQFKSPYIFDPYHTKITEPFNFYQFGIDFLKPLVDLSASKIYGLENLELMREYINKKENVILFYNHQTESDPQVINLLIKDKYSDIASEIIFVAGERVITDPLAIPFSMGCNLLCIFSKRYIDVDPNLQHQKLMHNKKVMSLMKNLLTAGGKIICVAPSGGRDRKDENGNIKIADFDPQSLEMFYLMCKKAKKPTHFFLLTLDTYDLLPPPETIQIEMGEERIVKRNPVSLSFSKEIDIKKFPFSDEKNKIEKRKNRAKYLYNIVKKEYERITKEK